MSTEQQGFLQVNAEDASPTAMDVDEPDANGTLHQNNNDHNDTEEEEEPIIAEAVVDSDVEEEEEEATQVAMVLHDEDVAAVAAIADVADADVPDADIVVAVPAPPLKKKAAKKNTPTTTVKKKPAKKASKTSKTPSSTTTSAASIKKKHATPGRNKFDWHVPPKCAKAATDARAMLQATVPTLPMILADTTVRSFGRLYVDNTENKFVTTSALYPIGFSCDRSEYSPVHGRMLKLRCCVLDGRSVKKKQRKGGFAVDERLHDGPVIRILWGPGIDQEVIAASEYPYDPLVHSLPLSPLDHEDEDDSLAAGAAPTLGAPEPGMKVQVRFEKGQYYCATIIEATKKKIKRQTQLYIKVRYDDGVEEEIGYPDPDVTLLLPGAEDEIDSLGRVELTRLNGKPVTCVVGNSPIEAWGRALTKLGLIDEIMCEMSLNAVEKSRDDAKKELKHRLNNHSANNSSTPKPARVANDDAMDTSGSRAPSPIISQHIQVQIDAQPQMNGNSSGDNGDIKHENGTDEVAETTVEKDDSEPPSERELHLRQRAAELLSELEELTQEGSQAATALSDARINLAGPFMCNPFRSDDPSKAQQASWLATAVRKEKTKMGSTGNKKKVVTAFDLLERNDTLFSADIEALIEGLPGSEYCGAYVFQTFRAHGGSALNRSWVHEAQLKREREALARVQRAKDALEKENMEMERFRKRKELDDVRDSRKRQKLAEEDDKKRARAEERLSRLRIQIDERLFNEAQFQREKVVLALVRSMNKEFARRRKAAETVAAHFVLKDKEITYNITAPSHGLCELRTLPSKLSTIYDEETLRVWDFMSTFGPFFVERGYLTEVPTLGALQLAVDSLRGMQNSSEVPSSNMAPELTKSATMSSIDAVSSLTDLAVAMCKPLAASLTRTLFASLISLNPALQKDFGASFFNEVNAASTPTKADLGPDEAPSASIDVLLPVNAMTWQEIARLSLVSDALAEIGLQKHEAAHIIRGYRSGGHPNSKEARRLRKAEDYWIAVLRQEVELGGHAVNTNVSIWADLPCAPMYKTSDYRYFLHNVLSVSDPSLADITKNILQANRVLKGSGVNASIRQNMNQLVNYVEGIIQTDPDGAKKAKVAVLNILGEVADIASDKFASDAANGLLNVSWDWHLKTDTSLGPIRQQMGLLNSLALDRKEYKHLTNEREKYIEDALQFKEEEKRKNQTGEDVDDDDDDGKLVVMREDITLLLVSNILIPDVRRRRG
jgi:hypothetical protein